MRFCRISDSLVSYPDRASLHGAMPNVGKAACGMALGGQRRPANTFLSDKTISGGIAHLRQPAALPRAGRYGAGETL
jgi:hypothetical protein